jgi:hypothetical protein
MTEPLISYGYPHGSKTLTATDDGNFIYKRTSWRSLTQSVVLTHSELFEAIGLWIKENS